MHKMQETTFYPARLEYPQSDIIHFAKKLRNFSSAMRTQSDFNLADLYDLLWLYWGKPDMEPYRNLISCYYTKVKDTILGILPFQELTKSIRDLENIFNLLASTEEKKENSFHRSQHRKEICKSLQYYISSLILENAPSETKEHFPNASFQEQQEILHSISCESPSQTLFLQFCSELFGNMDSITELLYKNHYKEISEE